MKIISFGYLHAPAPAAHLTIDLRDLFRDPHIDPAMRELTGLSQRVLDNVMRQPDARRFVRLLANVVILAQELVPDYIVAIGCAGGRHRSVVVARVLRGELFVPVQVEHRDVDKPVVDRGGAS